MCPAPRRVKHLLNTFALTYRLAEERHRTGLLSEHPRDSAAAIARLVCLRVEFPLFARDLEIDANLPSLVLQLVRDRTEPFPSSVSERAQQLARAYALAGAPPATVLTSEESTTASADEGSTEHQTGVADATSDASSPTPTARAHNKQLLNYLSRTRQVPGPSRNLIYMQSSGAVFGLDGELARALEQAAEDEDIDTLERRVRGLGDAERDGVVELLAQQIRTGSGVAAPNTARSFLHLTASMPDLHIDHVVDAVAEEICGLHDDATGVLDKDTVASAWALTNACSETGTGALRSRVIAATLAPGSKAPKDFLIDEALVALDAAPDEMSDYLASTLVSENGISTLSLLFATPDDDVIQVLATLRADVASRATKALAAHKDWTEAQQPSAGASPASTSTASTPTSEEEPYNPTALLLSLGEQAGTREAPVQHETLRLLLAIDARAARNSAEELIRKSEPTTEPELATAILESGRRRQTSLWPIWLHAVAPTAIRPAHAALIGQVLTSLWSNDSSDDETNAVLDALHPLIAALPPGAQPDLTSTVTNELDTFVTSSEEASERRRLLARAELFTAAGLVDSSLVAAAVVATLEDTLAETLGPVGRDDPLYLYIVEDGASAVAAQLDAISDRRVNGILSEAEASPWLDGLGHVEVPLIFAIRSGRSPAGLAALPTPQNIAGLVDDYTGSAAHAASLWVTLMRPGRDDFILVLDRLVAANAVSREFAEAAELVQVDWVSDQRRVVLNHYLSQPDTSVPDELTLRAIGLATVDDKVVADLLCERFSLATNNTQRKSVVSLWTNAHITDTTARKKLIETIVYGLLAFSTSDSRNIGAVELALIALETLGSPLPYGVKRALGERIKTAIHGNDDLEVKALRVLPHLGYSIKSGGLFGRTKRVDYTGT